MKRIFLISSLVVIILAAAVGYAHVTHAGVSMFLRPKISRCPSIEKPFNHQVLIAIANRKNPNVSYENVVKIAGRPGTLTEMTSDESGVTKSYVWCDGNIELTASFDNDGTTFDVVHGNGTRWFPKDEEELNFIEKAGGPDEGTDL